MAKDASEKAWEKLQNMMHKERMPQKHSKLVRQAHAIHVDMKRAKIQREARKMDDHYAREVDAIYAKHVPRHWRTYKVC